MTTPLYPSSTERRGSLERSLASQRKAFMERTADVQPTLEQWKSWTPRPSMPERHKQPKLPGLDDGSIRRGFRRRRSPRALLTSYSCARRRPGRSSRWAEAELRSLDLYAADLIPAAVLHESHLSPADRRVLLALLLLSKGRETWTLHMAPIANLARVARSTAHLAVARLARAGYIARKQNPISGDRNGPNTWTILDARLLATATEVARSARRSADSTAPFQSDRVQKNDPVNHSTDSSYRFRRSTEHAAGSSPPSGGGICAKGAPPLSHPERRRS